MYLVAAVCILGLCACQNRPTYSFSTRSTLADHGTIMLTAIIEVDNAEIIKEIEGNIKQIKYGLALVFSEMNTHELAQKGKAKTENSIKRIVKQVLNKNVRQVTITEYAVHPA